MTTEQTVAHEKARRIENEQLLLLLSKIVTRYGKMIRWVLSLLKTLLAWGASFGMGGPQIAKIEEEIEKLIAEITDWDAIIEREFKALRLREEKRKEKAAAFKLKQAGMDR